MSADYPPGTVAKVRFAWGMGEHHTCLRAERHGKLGWLHNRLDGFTADDHPAGPTNIRPLVVLDPQAHRFYPELLVRALRAKTGYTTLADAIEAQTCPPKPPKPPEPTGLGAVVEDAEGDRWVRADKGVRVWTNGRYGTTTTWDVGNPYAEVYLCKWDEIDAVRVLSEGVQP